MESIVRLAPAAIATSSAATAAGLSEIIGVIPDEWGPLGGACALICWFVWTVHDRLLAEIRPIKRDLAAVMVSAAESRARADGLARFVHYQHPGGNDDNRPS
jgi:hypothetical protein